MKPTENELIQRIQNGLQCSREEAEAIRAYDKAVDKGKQQILTLLQNKGKLAVKWQEPTRRRKPPRLTNLRSGNENQIFPKRELSTRFSVS